MNTNNSLSLMQGIATFSLMFSLGLAYIINPIEATVKLDPAPKTDTSVDIGPPNFNLSVEDIFTVPSGQKTFDQILILS